LRLAEWLELHKVTAADLARRTGLHETTIGRIRSGRAEPPRATRALIVKATEGAVTHLDLIGGHADGSASGRRRRRAAAAADPAVDGP
jgi:transcriptional regulator with XRE-family HTH domain